MGQHSRSLNAQTAVQQLGLDKAELVLSPSSAQMSKSHPVTSCPSTCLTNYRRPGEAIGDVTCSLGRAPEPTAPTTFTPHYNPLYKPQRESALQPNRGRNDGNIRWPRLLPDPLIKKRKRKKMQTDPQLPLTPQAMTSENSCRASA